jgi:hypothetical protein
MFRQEQRSSDLNADRKSWTAFSTTKDQEKQVREQLLNANTYTGTWWSEFFQSQNVFRFEKITTPVCSCVVVIVLESADTRMPPKKEGGDTSAKAVARKEVDVIAKNAVWGEICKKERLHFKLSENFAPNPKSLLVLPEKPTKTTPDGLKFTGSEMPVLTSVVSELSRSLRDSGLIAARPPRPQLPLTSSQEFGFYETVRRSIRLLTDC